MLSFPSISAFANATSFIISTNFFCFSLLSLSRTHGKATTRSRPESVGWPEWVEGTKVHRENCNPFINQEVVVLFLILWSFFPCCRANGRTTLPPGPSSRKRRKSPWTCVSNKMASFGSLLTTSSRILTLSCWLIWRPTRWPPSCSIAIAAWSLIGTASSGARRSLKGE